MVRQGDGGEEDEGPGEDLVGDGPSGDKAAGPRDEAPMKQEKRALF